MSGIKSQLGLGTAAWWKSKQGYRFNPWPHRKCKQMLVLPQFLVLFQVTFKLKLNKRGNASVMGDICLRASSVLPLHKNVPSRSLSTLTQRRQLVCPW